MSLGSKALDLFRKSLNQDVSGFKWFGFDPKRSEPGCIWVQVFWIVSEKACIGMSLGSSVFDLFRKGLNQDVSGFKCFGSVPERLEPGCLWVQVFWICSEKD